MRVCGFVLRRFSSSLSARLNLYIQRGSATYAFVLAVPPAEACRLRGEGLEREGKRERERERETLLVVP